MFKIHIVEILNKDLWVVLKRLLGNQETERVSELKRNFGEAGRVLKELIKKQIVEYEKSAGD